MQHYTLPEKPENKRNPALSYLNGLSSENSCVTMQNCLKQVAKMLGQDDLFKTDWSALRRHHCLHIMDVLKARELAPATINLYLYAMKGTAREAWSMDLMPQAAYLKIDAIKCLHYARLPTGCSLTTRQCRQLLKVCEDGSLRGIRDRALLAVMMGCGLRRAEITGLNVTDWNEKDRTFTFVGKGNKQRKVFLPPTMLDPFKRWMNIRGFDEGAIFPAIYKGNGEHEFFKIRNMLPSSINRIVQRRAKQAKIPDISPHDLRRTFATRMLEAGIDLFVLQQSMGHANLATTTRYDRRGDKAKEKAAKALRF